MQTFSTLDELKREYLSRAEQMDLQVQCPMEGNVRATIAVVGEAPGNEEARKKRPFVGESGKLMWQTFRQHKILRPQLYITNVAKRQAPSSQYTKKPMSLDEKNKWRELLIWELRHLPNLKYILCLGDDAMTALFPENQSGISKHRGSVYKWEGIPVMPTFNPAYCLREPKTEIIYQMDMMRFTNVLSGTFQQHHVEALINPSFNEAMDFVNELIQSERPISWDIETTNQQTACHGLSNDPHLAMCINLRDRSSNRYTPDQEYELLRKLQEMGDKKRIIAQNGNFDATWTGYKDYLRIPIWFDTLLAHHTLYPSLPHGLDFLVSQYTTHPYYKDEINKYKEGESIDTYWEYNCKDAALTYAAYEGLRRELEAQGLADFFYEKVMGLEPHLWQITCDGIATDPVVKNQVAEELIDDLEEQRMRMLAHIRKYLNMPHYTINFNSNDQMRILLFTHMKVGTKVNSLDEKAREKILDDSRVPFEVKDFLVMFNKYKKDIKFCGTYAEMELDKDNRFRPIFKQQGVSKAPGRLSSSKNLWGTAGNAQNFPARAYDFIIADDGTVMFYFDLAQAEARVVAWLAEIEKWKEDFEKARLGGNFDCHRSLAADMWKIPYDQVPTKDILDCNGNYPGHPDYDGASGEFTLRYKAKRCRHGLNYRMFWPRLAETTGMSLYEAKKAYVLYHEASPEVQKWWDATERVVRKERCLWTPMGRRYKVQQRIDRDAMESLIAFVPQSTIGDKVKNVLRQSQEDPRWDNNKARIKLNIHDALIGIAKPEYAKTALSICMKYAEEPIYIENIYKTNRSPLIIPADPKLSVPDELGIHRWSTLRDTDVQAA